MGPKDRYVAALLALLMSGTPIFVQAESPDPQWTVFPVSFLDSTGGPSQTVKTIPNMVVDWGALGGTFWGMADQHLQVAHFESGPKSRVDFARLAIEVDAHAKTIKDKAREMSITVAPEDTRFAEVFPGLDLHPATGSFSFNTNLFDVATNNRLVLMWFDKPCRLTGTVVGTVKSTNYDVEVVKPGFVWVEFTAVDEKMMLAKRIDSEVDFKLVVTVR